MALPRRPQPNYSSLPQDKISASYRDGKQLGYRGKVAVNTLLARKRYAVLNLRARLHTVYAEWDL